ncbi:MAG: hypothetical protein WBK77_05215 [Alphaproteobacteria bacterium]
MNRETKPVRTAGEMLAERLRDFIKTQRSLRAEVTINPHTTHGGELSFYFKDFAKYANIDETVKNINRAAPGGIGEYFIAETIGNGFSLSTPWYDANKGWIAQQAVRIIADEHDLTRR